MSTQSASKIIFLTNHALVLLAIRNDKDVRMRDIAASIGITERAVQRIIDELIAEAFLIATKVGRRNTYQIDPAKKLGFPLSDCRLSDLLKLCDSPNP